MFIRICEDGRIIRLAEQEDYFIIHGFMFTNSPAINGAVTLTDVAVTADDKRDASTPI